MERLLLREILPQPHPSDPELEEALGVGESRPWFVQGLLGCGTWIGAILIAIVLMVTLDKHRVSALALVAGPLFLGSAVAISRLRRGVIFTQLTFIGSLGGQCLLLFGFGETLHVRDQQLLLAAIALQALLLVAVQSSPHRFLSAAGLVAMSYLYLREERICDSEIAVLTVALVLPILAWLFESRLSVSWVAKGWRPAAFGCLAAGLVLLGWPWHGIRGLAYEHMEAGRWFLNFGLGASAFTMAWRILQGQGLALASSPGILACVAALLCGVLGYFSAGLAAALLVLTLGQHRNEVVLKGLGLAALAYFLWNFYFSLETPLLQKALWMGATGMVLLAGRMALGRGPRLLESLDRLDRTAWLVLGATGFVLLVVVGLVVRKEHLLATGQHVLLELAPVDPRSLMQGDYMNLRYGLAQELERNQALPMEGRVVLNLGTDDVVTFVRLDDGSPLAPGQVRLRYRQRDDAITLGAESFFFQEGMAGVYSGARFGELVITPDGGSVLVGLRDKDRKKL